MNTLPREIRPAAGGTGAFTRRTMEEIQMTAEARTDYDCEATGLPAQKWAEAVFSVRGEEIVLEVSVEDSVIVAVSAGKTGEEAVWKGTLEGLKKLLMGEIAGR